LSGNAGLIADSHTFLGSSTLDREMAADVLGPLDRVAEHESRLRAQNAILDPRRQRLGHGRLPGHVAGVHFGWQRGFSARAPFSTYLYRSELRSCV
jgi:hypothetical protein